MVAKRYRHNMKQYKWTKDNAIWISIAELSQLPIFFLGYVVCIIWVRE
jgi:hypothetical protein